MNRLNEGPSEGTVPRWLGISAGALAGTLYGGAAGLFTFWLLGGLIVGCTLPLAWLVPLPVAVWFAPGGPLSGLLLGDVFLLLLAVVGFVAGIREGARSGLDRWEIGYPLLAALAAAPLGWLIGLLAIAPQLTPGHGLLAPLVQPHSVALTSASVLVTSIGILFGISKGSPLFH